MQKGASVYIPQPCHENWDNMNPSEKGKFCNACAKQVVDFTGMSDQQVLNFFSNATGRVCGRFAEDQLQRPLLPVVTEKKKAWWFAALMPLLLLFDRADAQKKVCSADTSVVQRNDPKEIIMGKVSPPKPILSNGDSTINVSDSLREPGIMGDTEMLTPDTAIIVNDFVLEATNTLIIEGTVADNNGNPLQYANVSVAGQSIEVLTNSGGFFQVVLNDFSGTENILLSVSSIGYEPANIGVSTADAISSFDPDGNCRYKKIALNPIIINQQVTGEIAIVTVGGAIACKRITAKDTIPMLIREIFNNAAFKVFPNPAPKGNDISVELKNKGSFTVQLLDNTSKLLLIKEVNSNEESTVTSLSIPSSIASGIYYIRVADEKKKKQYITKIIIQ